MTNTFQAKLINQGNFDPGLYLRFSHLKKAILFDLPELSNLSPKEILKVEEVFVTHTHMDHFIGFDQMLRLSLGREKTIKIYGPEGIIKNVEGKLQGYTWNLIENYEGELKIIVNEIRETTFKIAIFSSKNAFKKVNESEQDRFDNIILAQPDYRIYAIILDHLIPSLAFMLEENLKINILKDKLKELNLTPGPWLSDFKQSIFLNKSETEKIVIKENKPHFKNERIFYLGELKNKIVKITDGTRIAYITDIIGSDDNINKIVTNFGYCDILFIEAGFLSADQDRAKKTYHLTTNEAGRIAALLKAKSLNIFHHSFRYKGQEQFLLNEALMSYHSYLGQAELSP